MRYSGGEQLERKDAFEGAGGVILKQGHEESERLGQGRKRASGSNGRREDLG